VNLRLRFPDAAVSSLTRIVPPFSSRTRTACLGFAPTSVSSKPSAIGSGGGGGGSRMESMGCGLTGDVSRSRYSGSSPAVAAMALTAAWQSGSSGRWS